MKKMNPFFAIGTTGFVVIATLHIIMALVLNMPAVHPVFMALYPAFAIFLILGTAQIINGQKAAPVKVRANNKRY
ncbi:hypothetical protein [Mucilaginibacter auburnensis]|uniref:Uncharacterized protein n=1 Tax=Mucilaginibacter auburnensis TaxID=1457233 RepID=A0A2H9VS28_9SPHI|nr:hypothetical protein [Mucilaginibacter auburnensis]PJJ83623.1 hypothetical protein CLV57_0609 [Mucilaginibacter auburnensis]